MITLSTEKNDYTMTDVVVSLPKILVDLRVEPANQCNYYTFRDVVDDNGLEPLAPSTSRRCSTN